MCDAATPKPDTEPSAARVPRPERWEPVALAHPLPAGMRDLLPEEAESRERLGRAILERFSLHGYALITPPAFEFSDVLERGLGTLEPSDVLRFVEPESGEVAALRPDMTPQIARVVATRLRGRPAPYRLCYEGTVLRRRSGRARKQRQIPQVGVELAGVSGPEGDLELLAVAIDALEAAGLQDFAIDVGHAGIVRALLNGADPALVSLVSSALAQKDEATLEAVLSAHRGASISGGHLLAPLLRLHGGTDPLATLDEGARLLAGSAAEGAVARLRQLFHEAHERGLASHFSVDLAEVRGFAYYTGPLFHIYAPGPGEAVGSGGRYDELLGRFGAPMPAVGFALDLDRLAWALQHAGAPAAVVPRVIVVGDGAESRARTYRKSGLAAVVMADVGAALAYARAWGFSAIVSEREIVDVPTGVARPLPAGPSAAAALAALAVGLPRAAP